MGLLGALATGIGSGLEGVSKNLDRESAYQQQMAMLREKLNIERSGKELDRQEGQVRFQEARGKLLQDAAGSEYSGAMEAYKNAEGIEGMSADEVRQAGTQHVQGLIDSYRPDAKTSAQIDARAALEVGDRDRGTLANQQMQAIGRDEYYEAAGRARDAEADLKRALAEAKRKPTEKPLTWRDSKEGRESYAAAQKDVESIGYVRVAGEDGKTTSVLPREVNLFVSSEMQKMLQENPGADPMAVGGVAKNRLNMLIARAKDSPTWKTDPEEAVNKEIANYRSALAARQNQKPQATVEQKAEPVEQREKKPDQKPEPEPRTDQPRSVGGMIEQEMQRSRTRQPPENSSFAERQKVVIDRESKIKNDSELQKLMLDHKQALRDGKAIKANSILSEYNRLREERYGR